MNGCICSCGFRLPCAPVFDKPMRAVCIKKRRKEGTHRHVNIHFHECRREHVEWVHVCFREPVRAPLGLDVGVYGESLLE